SAVPMGESSFFTRMTGAPGRINCDGNGESKSTTKTAPAAARGRALLFGISDARPRGTPKCLSAARPAPRKRTALPNPHHLGFLRLDLPMGRAPTRRRDESL